MHEIVTVSLSHRSNHLATQWFNVQERNLYCKEYDPNIFLSARKDQVTKTVSYSPRALLWDAKTGNGSLGFHEFQNTGDYYYGEQSEDKAPKDQEAELFVAPRIEKSQYQKALDAGHELPELHAQNTKYWSDYSHLLYQPSSINILNSWYHNVSNPNEPDFENLGQQKFKDFQLGYDEFMANYCNNFFDDNFRRQLEECDALQGFNVITDTDNAWGGFTTALLEELRNELPKKNLITWAANESDPSLSGKPLSKTALVVARNKVKTILGLAAESDLVVPLYCQPELSNWDVSSMLCPAYDAVNSVFSQKNPEQRKSMEYFIQQLTCGEQLRNVVTNVKLDGKELGFPSSMIGFQNSHKNYHQFSQCVIERISSPPVHKAPKSLYTFAFNRPQTLSNGSCTAEHYKLELSQTSLSRITFRSWYDVYKRYAKSDVDRDEILEDLGNRSSVYEHGWYDDEDSGDDL